MGVEGVLPEEQVVLDQHEVHVLGNVVKLLLEELVREDEAEVPAGGHSPTLGVNVSGQPCRVWCRNR
ncbi:hypothetical protein NtRootA9_25280 [Arthrobacter sp. NtRootA9]|nr:hypothetical protein NtRootA9_25280 [Arthrobacter sp. NtRootA9]